VKTKTDVSIWMRNVQLGLFSLPQAAFLMAADNAVIGSQGPLVGFSPLVWSVVVLKGLGGLLVAAVVKHADNVLKTYATAIAILLTFAVGCISTRTLPSAGLVQGLTMVRSPPAINSQVLCSSLRSKSDWCVRACPILPGHRFNTAL
jgi:UDP-sugar transporter A1/2/3